MRRARSFCTVLSFLTLLGLHSHLVSAQLADDSLFSDIAALKAEIKKAEDEDQRYTGGLVKSLISLRLATLRQTAALLDQRALAISARTTLQYTIDGKPFVPPSDATAQLSSVERELAHNATKIAEQEIEVARYSGGLVQATALVTLATLRQTEAMLQQKRLALKYGLPQFVGFKDLPTSRTMPSPPPASPIAGDMSASVDTAVTEPSPKKPPADCLKQVFRNFCLGTNVSSLPPNPARKTDVSWAYVDPDPTVVTIVDGKVAAVGRFYSPGTWLTYRDLERTLVEKYGPGKDLSFFPSYADDSSSRETSISLKRGRAVRSWQQEGYTIQLKWESRDHVVLMYFHDDLEAERTARKKDEF